MIIMALVSVAACNKRDNALKLHSREAFLHTLSGSWLLKNYLDSVDKGSTPNQIKHLLTDYYFIGFNQQLDYYTAHYTDLIGDTILVLALADHQLESRYALTLDTIQGVAYITNFEPAYNPDSIDRKTEDYKVFFKEKEIQGILRFYTIDSDTLVKLESVAGSKRHFTQTFRKASNKNTCSFSQVYGYSDYLISRFISGSYEVLDSSSRATNGSIYFSECEQTNAYNQLYKPTNADTYSRFSVSMTENEIIFDSDSAKVAIGVGWSRKGDTLLLTDPSNQHVIHHKLIKRRKNAI